MARPPTVDDARLRELHRAGRTSAEMAAEVGLSPRRVQQRLRELELEPNARPRQVRITLRVSPEQRAELRRRAAAAGVTMTTWILAAALRVTP